MQKPKVEEPMVRTHNAESSSFLNAPTALRPSKGLEISRGKADAIKVDGQVVAKMDFRRAKSHSRLQT